MILILYTYVPISRSALYTCGFLYSGMVFQFILISLYLCRSAFVDMFALFWADITQATRLIIVLSYVLPYIGKV